MRTPARSFVALCGLCTLLASCITIRENYSFKRDGSGAMEFVVDASEMGKMLKEMGMDPGDAEKSGNGDGMKLTDKVDALKALPGISKVKQKEKDFVESVIFNFESIEALNAALNVLMPDSASPEHRFFSWEGSTLVRTGNSLTSEMSEGSGLFGASGGEGEDSEAKAMELSKSMKYEINFVFMDDIHATEFAPGIERSSTDKKQLTAKTDWSVLTADAHALDMRIDLSK
ncbi:MAG: hypothetical protein WAU70_11525 [Flavobacteriales bacterium]